MTRPHSGVPSRACQAGSIAMAESELGLSRERQRPGRAARQSRDRTVQINDCFWPAYDDTALASGVQCGSMANHGDGAGSSCGPVRPRPYADSLPTPRRVSPSRRSRRCLRPRPIAGRSPPRRECDDLVYPVLASTTGSVRPCVFWVRDAPARAALRMTGQRGPRCWSDRRISKQDAPSSGTKGLRGDVLWGRRLFLHYIDAEIRSGCSVRMSIATIASDSSIRA